MSARRRARTLTVPASDADEGIAYVAGVPHWFTRLHHRISRRRCQRRGHLVDWHYATRLIPLWICNHCGQLLPPRNHIRA